MTSEEAVKDLPDEKKEFLNIVQVGRHDPVFFAESLLGLMLHDGQKCWLWMTTKTQRDKCFDLGLTLNLWKDRQAFDSIIEKNPEFLKNLLVPSNRWGKTLVTAVKHIWYNHYKIGARGDPSKVSELRCGTLNLSPHSNQAQAGYDYILDILGSRLIWMIDGQSYKNECKIGDFYLSDAKQKHTIFFKNGSCYKAFPTGEDQASSLAGTPYLYISYDECAQSLHLKSELPAKIMSRLIDFGGPLDLVSTPEVDKPSHQYFFHIAKKGIAVEEGWWTMIGKILDNTFLGTKEIEKISVSIKATDPVKYRQVMFGEFVTTGKKMFDTLLIERLWDEEKSQQTLLDHKYLVVADWGFSDTGDPTVFYILDYTNAPNYRISYREDIRGGSPFAVLARAKMLCREWNGAKFLHDSSAMGGVILKKMMAEMEMHDVIDFTSGGGQKADMLFVMLLVMSANRKTEVDVEMKVKDLNPNFGRLRSFYISQLEEQLGNYQYNPDKGISDKRLEQDDVMALGMGLWWLERKFMKNEMKMINFNPLAPALDSLMGMKEAGVLHVRNITIPEKRIL